MLHVLPNRQVIINVLFNTELESLQKREKNPLCKTLVTDC